MNDSNIMEFEGELSPTYSGPMVGSSLYTSVPSETDP